MRGSLHNIGLWAFACGIISGGAFMVFAIGYLVIVVVPFFFYRGDYVPVILAGITSFIMFGGILAGVTSKREPSK